jgi:LysM repeat protein
MVQANGIEDAHSLQEGQELWIPRTYQIKKGDTLYSISKKFGVTVEAIQRANGIQDADLIHEGDHIVLPEDSNAEDTGMVR